MSFSSHHHFCFSSLARSLCARALFFLRWHPIWVMWAANLAYVCVRIRSKETGHPSMHGSGSVVCACSNRAEHCGVFKMFAARRDAEPSAMHCAKLLSFHLSTSTKCFALVVVVLALLRFVCTQVVIWAAGTFVIYWICNLGADVVWCGKPLESAKNVLRWSTAWR